MMASNALKNPFLRVVANRSFSAQAAANPAASLEVKTSVLSNKLVVASVENFSPVSTVSISFRAGSRYEAYDELGTTHVLRIATGLATTCYSQCGIIRNLQHLGANLTCTSDRELISYTLEGTCKVLGETLDILGNVATAQEFKPWEISDNVPRLRYDLASIPPAVKAVELLHKAAFKTGLGNSLFCPKHHIGKIDPESLKHYVECNFTSNRAAVVGVGVSHVKLAEFAQRLNLESGEGSHSPSGYRGGEIRQDTTAPLAHVAIATEGAGFQNLKEALAFGVIQFAFGAGPSVKWGVQACSPLGKTVSQYSAHGPAAITALSASYADTGLFGFVISCEPSSASGIVKAAVQQLRGGKLSDADITRGKTQLKAHLFMSTESSNELTYDIAAQSLLLGKVNCSKGVACSVDEITNKDITAALKKIASGKLSIGAVGSIGCVPYLDEL